MAGLLVVAILIGAGAEYLTGSTSQKTVISTATSTSSTTLVLTSATTNTQTVTLQPSSANASEVCISNLATPDWSQYAAALHPIIVNPSFIQYSNGRCWAFEGMFVASGPRSYNDTFVFEHFSDYISYPCGKLSYVADIMLYVIPTYSSNVITSYPTNGTVTSLSIQVQRGPFSTSCGFGFGIQPVGLNLISWNSTGQTVSLELYSTLNAPLSSLEARVFNSSWSYLMPITHVNSTNFLQPWSTVEQEVSIPGAPLRGNTVYDMTATGTYINGTQVVSNFQVQMQT